MLLQFQVNKQIICRTDCEKPVAKSENYLYAQFSFSDEWEGIKTAIFNNGTPYSVILDDDNKCLVPWEVITASGFSVSVFCGERITANVFFVKVLPTGYIEGETPEEPSLTVYEQILDKLDDKLSPSNIKGGTNVTIETDGNDVTINAQGGGGASYTAGDGIEIDGDEVSVKKGDGLTFNQRALALAYTVLEAEIDEQGQEKFVYPYRPLNDNGVFSAAYLAVLFNTLADAINTKQDKLNTIWDGIEITASNSLRLLLDSTLKIDNGNLGIDFSEIDPETGDWKDDKALKATDWLLNQGDLVVGTQAGQVIYGALNGEYPLNTQKALNFFDSVVLPLINAKANASNTYTKTQVDTAVNAKISAPANASDGDFLRYRNGSWVAEAIASAESEGF